MYSEFLAHIRDRKTGGGGGSGWGEYAILVPCSNVVAVLSSTMYRFTQSEIYEELQKIAADSSTCNE